MNFYGKAESAAQGILSAFQDTNSLPKPLAQIFIRRKNRPHFSKWSWGNQLLTILHGSSDARTFLQWQEAGRNVRKGEKAFFILAPVTKKIETSSGEEKTIVVGFKGLPVFGLEQTDGPPLPTCDPETEKWLASLPLLDVAKQWGLSVKVFEGQEASFLGLYRSRKSIHLGVKNLSTWAHELTHAADDRNGNLKEKGQHWCSETVAELGGAVLLEILGFSHDADLGGCWQYIQTYAANEKISATEACMRVLDRTCKAVALILDTAEKTIDALAGIKVCVEG